MAAVVQVKGSSLASRMLWVDLGHGEAGRTRVRDACSPELRATIDGGITKAAWYPLPQFIELCGLIDREFGHGDLALVRELGRHGAEANLTTIYRLFYKVGTVHWILGRGVRLWRAHYDSGRLDVMTRGSHGAVSRLRDFATPHPVHCMSLVGWYERSIELSGGRSVQVTETRCRNRGDEYCQMEASWE